MHAFRHEADVSVAGMVKACYLSLLKSADDSLAACPQKDSDFRHVQSWFISESFVKLLPDTVVNVKFRHYAPLTQRL